MATTITSFSHQYQINALDAYNYTIQTAGVHIVKVRISDVTTPAGITVVIKQNGTTLATASAPAAQSGKPITLNVLANCAVNDVMSVVVTSTTASDSAPNQIRGTINIHVGVS
jgi:hypothetical protein